MTEEYYVTHRSGLKLKLGNKVILKANNFRSIDSLNSNGHVVGTVITVDNQNTELEVDGLGMVKAYELGEAPQPAPGNSRTELRVAYVNSLKTNDHGVMIDYADRIMTIDNSKPVSCYITEVNKDSVKGRLVGQSYISLSQYEDEDDFMVLVGRRYPKQEFVSSLNGADISMELPIVTHDFSREFITELPKQNDSPALSIGDHLIARDFELLYADGQLTALLADISVVNNTKTIAEAVSFLGLSETNRYILPSLASGYEMVRAHGIAQAKTEPDSALVVVCKDGENEITNVLHTTGYEAFINEDIQASLEDAAPGVGLWVMENLKNHGWQCQEGDWDASVEGNWRAASMDDVVHFFGSSETLDDVIAETIEIDCEPGMTQRYIALAEVKSFEIDFEKRHKELALKRFGVVDEKHFLLNINMVKNPEMLEEFLERELSPIQNGKLRDQVAVLVRKDILKRSSQFYLYSNPNLAIKRNIGMPLSFQPTTELYEDIEFVKRVVLMNEEKFSNSVNSGIDFSRSTLTGFMKTVIREGMTKDGKREFSDARNSKGKWFAIEDGNRILALALFVGDRHIATLELRGEKSRLADSLGLKITSETARNQDFRSPSIQSIALDADRAFCEIEARLLSGVQLLDRLPDGVYQSGFGITYVEDGVLHREDGPALISGLDSNSVINEYRFRGNIEQDEDRTRNEAYFAALAVAMASNDECILTSEQIVEETRLQA